MIQDTAIVTMECEFKLSNGTIVIFNDLKWLSEILNDKKHRAVSLRQLSFL